jgi:hypothetical protein
MRLRLYRFVSLASVLGLSVIVTAHKVAAAMPNSSPFGS